MPNTSATGGYLVPTTGPLEDQALRRFVQAMLVGLVALAGDKVRPSRQKNPPPMPDVDTDWLAFWITNQKPDANPYHEQHADHATLIRHEEFDIMCSFYGPNCMGNAGKLRDGLYLSQNRESLFLASMGLVGFSDTTHVPELVNDRWFDRADITLTLRREIKRDYPILHFVAAYGTISGNRATETLSIDWSA